jgi:hypothetical protein
MALVNKRQVPKEVAVVKPSRLTTSRETKSATADMRNNLDGPKPGEEEAPKTPSSSRQQASTPTTLPSSPTRFGKVASVETYTDSRRSVEEALNNRFSRLTPTCTFRYVASFCPNCEARLSGRAGLRLFTNRSLPGLSTLNPSRKFQYFASLISARSQSALAALEEGDLTRSPFRILRAEATKRLEVVRAKLVTKQAERSARLQGQWTRRT